MFLNVNVRQMHINVVELGETGVILNLIDFLLNITLIGLNLYL